MTIECTCIVQEGQISAEQEQVLRAETGTFVRNSFGDDPAIEWSVVPRGSGFTAAKPSNSVLIAVNSNRPLDRVQREPLLRELGDIWIAGADLTPDEVVTVIRDPQD